MASSASDAGPLIGLTTYLEQARTGVWDVPAAFLPNKYVGHVTDAGGIALLLPPQPVGAGVADRVLDGIDGLIVTGGKDVDPARYGQERHPLTDEPRRDRDDWESTLLGRAIDRGIPFLGICRGLQVLNVVRGGTLLQHLPDVIGHERYNAGGGRYTVNVATVDADTRLSALLDEQPRIDVKSYHHQAIDRPGEGLRITARGADGIAQAAELEDAPFGIAVQWHPEEDEDLRLFRGLVEAARAHRAVRAGVAA